jgi:hypothetical protein
MTLSLKRPSFVGALYANPRAEISDCKYGPTVGKEGCSLGLGKSDEGKGLFSAEAVCSRESGFATPIRRIRRSSRKVVWRAVAFRFFIADGSDDLQPFEFSRGESCPGSGSLTDSMPSTRESWDFSIRRNNRYDVGIIRWKERWKT